MLLSPPAFAFRSIRWPSGLPPNLSWLRQGSNTASRGAPFQRIRLSPDPTRARVLSDLIGNVLSGLVPPAPHCRLTGSAEALYPATALPVILGGRDATGYYGLSVPVSALGISHPILTEADHWFRRCSCRKCCAAVGALLTPGRGVPRVELATQDVRPLWLPLYCSV